MKRVIEGKDLIELLTGYYKYIAFESYGINNWEYYRDSLGQFLEETPMLFRKIFSVSFFNIYERKCFYYAY